MKKSFLAIFILAGFALALLPSAQAYITFDANHVAVWEMENLTGFDSSGNGHTLNITGGANTPAVVGNGINDILASTPDSADFNTQTVTVETWFNLTTTNFGMVVYKPKNSGDSSPQIGIDYETNGAIFCAGTGFNFMLYDGATTVCAHAEVDLVQNQTYYVVGSYDGTNARIYVNGTLYATVPTAYSTFNEPVCLGERCQGDLSSSGTIDETYWSNVNRSASYVTNTYNAYQFPTFPPVITNVSADPASPVVRNSTDAFLVTINATVTGTPAVDQSILTFAGTNYTMANSVNSSIYTGALLTGCGDFSYFITANDTTGTSTTTSPFDYNVTCGFTVPTILLTQPTGYYNFTAVPFEFTAFNNETLSACWYTLDGVNLSYISECAGVVMANVSTALNASEGMHTVDLYVNDSYGITNHTFSNFAVDLTPPSLTINSPSGQTPSPFTLSYSRSDALSGINASSCYYILDANASVPLASCASASVMASLGNHTLQVFVSDNAGNQVTHSVAFEIINAPTPPLKITGATGVVYAFIPLFFSLAFIASGFALMFQGSNEKDNKKLILGGILMIIGITLIGIASSIVGSYL